MNSLHIALQDGFHDDCVIIRVNGKELFNKSGVTTNRVISLADTFDCTVDTVTATIEVAVTTKKTGGALVVPVGEFPFVAVIVGKDAAVELIPSQESFRYC
jgi:hypothetical protein